MFIAVVGALPPSIFIASSLMADALFISLCAIFIALFMAITTHNKQVSKTELVFLTVLTIMLFMCKIGYASLAILVLTLPRNILTRKRKVLYSGLSAGIAVTVYGIWSAFYSTTWAIASVSDNLEFILRHPLRIFMALAWNIMQDSLDLLRLGALSIGCVIILGIAWGILFHNSHLEPRREATTLEFISRCRYQITALLVFLILAYLAYASMMITWNDLPSMRVADRILGVQDRYFEPFLPLLVSIAFQHTEKTEIRYCGSETATR